MILNHIGFKLDDDPVPLLYLGPTKNFVERVMHKRVVALLNGCATLNAKQKQGKQPKTEKSVSGVTLRLAWAHSATEIAGDPAGICYCDERDRMPANVAGEGDPKELLDNRHATYPGGTTIVTSTPLIGTAEAKLDTRTGFEHWLVSEDVQSPTWQLWQEGTRHEWAWPCPECKAYFIPRFKLLWWPKGHNAEQVLMSARIRCPHCDAKIDDGHKTTMNAAGRFVAPGQFVDAAGDVIGEIPEGDSASFWVSGLCSPWKSYGQRASAFLKAVRSGESDRIQAVINTGMGELYRMSGDAPEWESVAALAGTYAMGTAPDDVRVVLLSCDIQKNSVIYVVRGYGYDNTSWLIDRGEIIGDTEKDEVWDELAKLRAVHYGAMPIRRAFIDSGYRAPQVYAFCRRFKGWAFPTKGHAEQDKPIKAVRIDINLDGKLIKNGLILWHLNSDYFKQGIHDHVNAGADKSKWHLPADIDENYCRQIVAETRIDKPSGKTVWHRLKKENHYLDCEYMNAACAYSLRVHMKTTAPLQQPVAMTPTPAASVPAPPRAGRRQISKGIKL